ncbi:MAG TPA: radical SAM protein, partial [Coriobacteriia bacterium]
MEQRLNRRREPRFSRHARAVLLHATPEKLENLVRVETEYRARRETVSGMPYLYFVDVCNYCNLRCPLCPSALGLFGRDRGMLRLGEYTSILDRIAPYAFEVNLHNWGEPFLNPDIFAIIEATRGRNVMPNVSSNLNTLDEARAEDVVRSGLEYLVVSLDGTTRDAYSRYRVGGDFDRVLDTLRAIVSAKRRLHSPTPTIEWQFLVMRHNEHQMDDARLLGAEIGVDIVRFSPAGLPFDRLTDVEMARPWMPDGPRFHDFDPGCLTAERTTFDRRHCHYLYRSMTIDPS